MKKAVRWLSVSLVVALCSLLSLQLIADDGQAAYDEVVRLSMMGKDAAAVNLYESVAEDEQIPVEVLRAAAGSYWRLRRFETARDLYRRILNSQPALVELREPGAEVDSGVLVAEDAEEAEAVVEEAAESERDAPEVAVPETDPEAVDPVADAEVVAETMPVEETADEQEPEAPEVSGEPAKAEEDPEALVEEPDVTAEEPEAAVVAAGDEAMEEAAVTDDALGEDDALAIALKRELDLLKTSYIELETERERRRAAIEARLDELVVQTQETIEELDALNMRALTAELARDEAEQSVEELETTRAQLQERTEVLEGSIAELDSELNATRDAYARLVVESENKSNELLDAVDQAQQERDAAKRALAAKEADAAMLTQRVRELEDAAAAAVAEANQMREAFRQEKAELREMLATSESLTEKQREALEIAERSLRAAESEADRRLAELADERDRLQNQLREQRETAEQAVAAAAQREAELRDQIARIGQQRLEAESMIETQAQQITDLELQLNVLRSQLADRDDQIADLTEQLSRSAVTLALEEIERLEREYAELTAMSQREGELLRDQVENLEQSNAMNVAELQVVNEALAKERTERERLEQEAESRQEELERANRMLDEATMALNRQYDLLRSELEDDGVSMSLEQGAVDEQNLTPLIGKLEAATESATTEVKQLRQQFEIERQTFARTLTAVQNERDALEREVEGLSRDLVKAQEERDSLEQRLTARIDELKSQQAGAKQELEQEVKRLTRALNGANVLANMLQQDLDTEREQQARTMRLARETEAALTARIEELEDELEGRVPDESMRGQQGDRPAAPATVPTEAVPAPGDEPVAKSSAASDEVVESSDEVGLLAQLNSFLPDDPAGAIAFFENRNPSSDLSVEVLKVMGNLYRDAENYDMAHRLFSLILEKDPGNLYAEQKLVMTLFDLGQYDQALDRLAGYEENSD